VGQLIWLDADTLIRERSQGKRVLDDFAQAFFGINEGSFIPVTYTFDDVVKTLNTVEPYDWAAFLHQRLDSIAKPAPLDGSRRGGYKLIYNDGSVSQVIWDSPAFKAKLTEGAQILAINGAAYSAEVLKDAIRSAKGTKSSIELIVKIGDRFMVARLDYHDGLRYPHLEREAPEPPRLDEILTAR
jgi:predicted metalloprotease with PDZ domain